ncbi:vacuolar h-atpase v1 subunit c [Ceraceosorus bombacis]|uniref:V-type proton ATPase subunit C n=1 Tax=Ceraceosorus bombacis TaxID=401625 RepID=A0A0P1BH00_9BASI|nr:vacuolar h-atpase v1 subunit c [Ceraceosorus bombacis]
MPTDGTYWLISVPLQDGDPHRMHTELASAVSKESQQGASIGDVSLPPLKAGTLSSLVSLADTLPKAVSAGETTLNKLLETLRALLNDDQAALAQHTLVREGAVDNYVVGGWAWNAAKYRVDQDLHDVVEVINRELTSIDAINKAKVNAYNAAKGQLTQLQRRKTGNLSVRSLADVVHRDDFADPKSEFLDTLLVAVPKNNIKDWQSKYERLAPMVVPRSSKKLAADEEFALFNVTVFKKTKDEYIQKARENKFTVREFEWDEEVVERERQELEDAGVSEKELWTEVLRLTRTNFSEAYQALTHLKVVRSFVESVLRFGLPADYFVAAIKPNPKRSKALVATLASHYAHLAAYDKRQSKSKSGGGGVNDGEVPGEFASLVEAEYYPFVLEELPIVAGST